MENMEISFILLTERKGRSCPATGEAISEARCGEPLPGHPDKQYLHVFHKKQLDLNWEKPGGQGRGLQKISGGGWRRDWAVSVLMLLST